jgi:DNA-binding response OmpR family regulator
MSPLANRRILVVEDEFLIGAVLCDMLEDASAIVVGRATTLDQAMSMVGNPEIEAVILDMNLNGQWSDAVADELRSRRVPFIITTGYGSTENTRRFGVPVVPKPYSWEEVEGQLVRALQECGAD